MKSDTPYRAAYRSEEAVLEAGRYNRVRLVLRRLGTPHWELLGRHGVEFQLERHTWLCRDLNLDNAPLVAWTDFIPLRDNLHLPVPCRRIFYSAYAGLLASRLLEQLDHRLLLRLSQHARALEPARAQSTQARIVSLPPLNQPR